MSNNSTGGVFDRPAYTIPEFCETHRISEGFYYQLKRQGKGPDEMEVGARRIISGESAAKWRAERTTAQSSLKAAIDKSATKNDPA